MAITGIEAFLQMLADAGVHYIFGNPGTTELPLNDALVDDDRFEYILGLQEVPVMAMADGFAMASGTLGVVNLHISCGLGNAMGMLYNAHREGTPLLVTAGQQDRRLKFREPILSSDMVRVVRPWTKWAAEVERVEDLPLAMRRAIQMALTPPTGPVFLSLPLDVQMAEAELDLTPASPVDLRVRPPADALRRAAEVLVEAENPAILVGSRVVQADAVDELVALAERLAAPVFSESSYNHGRLSFPCDHPLYAQGLPLWSPEIRERLAPYDVLFVVGMDLLRQYVYHEPARAIPQHIQLVHLDEDPYQLNKNYPLAVGVLGDSKVGLAELDSAVASLMTPRHLETAKRRSAELAQKHREAQERLRLRAQSQHCERPVTPLVMMESLAKVLPPDVAVVEEAVTTTGTTFERLGALKNTSGYFAHRGWALGWGLGVALGAQLAWPGRPVLAILGEGASLYGIQGLWSAARYRLPVTFVIANNAQYQILKFGGVGLGLQNAKAGRFVGLDMTEPEVDFVKLAESFGVKARRVTEPEELSQQVAESLSAAAQGSGEPLLLDVPIARETFERPL